MKKSILAFVLAIALTVAGFNLSYAKVNPAKTSAKAGAKIEKVANNKKSSGTKKNTKRARKSSKKMVKKAQSKKAQGK